MAKGNHVFNNFDRTIDAAFLDILEDLGGSQHLRTMNGSGGDLAAARAFMASKYANSWPLLQQIREHKSVEAIHWIQDDAAVGVSDENSKAYGKAAAFFIKSVGRWAMQTDGPNPIRAWRELTNVGIDKGAWDRFLAGSSLAKAPSSSNARRQLCEGTRKFVLGELTRLVERWLLELRVDLQAQSAVHYTTSKVMWEERLQRGYKRDLSSNGPGIS